MALEKIHFETIDGKTIDVHRAVDSVKRKTLIALNKAVRKGDIDQYDFDNELFKAAGLTKAQIDIIDDMVISDSNKFTELWLEGFEPGK
ncbi:MAG: hypothetical protein SPK00_07700 [Corynebacterium glucuronolyticum]|nr:hypothetical protein [Corynebacterium glucuronolyticum]MDD7587195.1 hypothetical protein [Mycobacteriaceae bacterium]MDY5834615.1 hypothetical protein [Corynebacterium glucuronolyticum]